LTDKKKKKKSPVFSFLIKLIIFIIALVLILVPVSIGVIMYLNAPPQAQAVEQDGIRITGDGHFYIDVRKGETSQSVGMRLERAGLIKNKLYWNILNRMESEHIKSGTFKIEYPSSQTAIHRHLVSGKQILYRVTIPEGVTLKKMADLFEDANICSAEDFLEAARDPHILQQYKIPNETMEGYLFPDTYLFPADYPASQAIKLMADNFFTKMENINPQVKEMSPAEINEKVIIASIVEREYRVDEEAAMMAGVFYNRLRINMALQSCATVQYIITEIQGKPHPTHIYNHDLEIRDPYNTYLFRGLPPGPISMPGEVALKASMFPENTDYLYFRLDDNSPTGRHLFSRTLDEHNVRAGQIVVKPQS
jgi:UPF0755 protein